MRAQSQKEFEFEAAHALPEVPPGHKCARPHGHQYRVVLTLEGDRGDATGWVMDFGDVKAAVAPILAQVDHRTLNEIPGLENPTAEVLADWLFDKSRCFKYFWSIEN